MPQVRYLGNRSAGDGTGKIRLEADENGHERVLVKNGPALDLSDAEVAQLKGRFKLEVDGDKPEPQASVSVEQSQPKQEAPAGQPAQFGAPPQNPPATPGASVSTPPTTP